MLVTPFQDAFQPTYQQSNTNPTSRIASIETCVTNLNMLVTRFQDAIQPTYQQSNTNPTARIASVTLVPATAVIGQERDNELEYRKPFHRQ
jgi:hypothetical protein